MNKLNSGAQLATEKGLERDLYHVRLAGYLLVFNSSNAHIAEVTESIVSADSVVKLGALYDLNFVRRCKFSRSLSRPAFHSIPYVPPVRRTKGHTDTPHKSGSLFNLADEIPTRRVEQNIQMVKSRPW